MLHGFYWSTVPMHVHFPNRLQFKNYIIGTTEVAILRT